MTTEGKVHQPTAAKKEPERVTLETTRTVSVKDEAGEKVIYRLEEQGGLVSVFKVAQRSGRVRVVDLLDAVERVSQ